MLWPFSLTGELVYLEMPAVSLLHRLGKGVLRAAREPCGPSRGSFLLHPPSQNSQEGGLGSKSLDGP